MIDIENPQAVVSATLEEVEFLKKLFPQLTPLEPNFTTPFFFVKDLRTKDEFDNIKMLEQSYLVVSNVLFDFQINDDILKSLTLSFKKFYFKSRKTTVIIPDYYNTLDYLNDFLFELQDEEQQDYILKLFETVGTRQFPTEFIALVEKKPAAPIIQAVITFLTKLQNPTTLFYKKASERLFRKYNLNYNFAATQYSYSYSHSLPEVDKVLLFVKFHQDLFQL